MLEVDGALVDVVTEREEKNAPREMLTRPTGCARSCAGTAVTHHGKPPASKIGPCSRLFRVLQDWISHVFTTSSRIGGSSAKAGKIISVMALSAHR